MHRAGRSCRAPALLCALLLLGNLVAACGRGGDEAGEPAASSGERARPMLVIGIDGASWKVLDPLFEAGDLPHLAGLAERGMTGVLETNYGASPVIWTTIATGRRPKAHGITDFVVPTPRGDVPVSSEVRRVPALWNMASTAGRRVALVSWWASWPAEPIDGVVVSDRALLSVDQRVHPEERTAEVDALIAEVEAAAAGARGEGEPGAEPLLFRGDDLAGRRDEVSARMGRRLLAERLPDGRAAYDLALVYFRDVDIVSHNSWKYFRPELFPGIPEAELAAHRDDVPAVYRATDAAIGRLLEAAGPDVNVIVISDHGFKAMAKEEIQMLFDLDAVLAELGYLTFKRNSRDDGPGAGGELGSIDLAASRAFTYSTPLHRPVKRVRYPLAGRDPGGRVSAKERPEIRAALERDLGEVTWPGGEPVFALRDAPDWQERLGADLIVEVLLEGAAEEVRIAGRPFPAAVRQLDRISGTHGKGTHGILIAAGPDIEPGVKIPGIDIHDMAATILFGLGLPVAEDFAGPPRPELYTQAFRTAHPLTTLPTWGKPGQGKARTSGADEEVLEELRALGYLN